MTKLFDKRDRVEVYGPARTFNNEGPHRKYQWLTVNSWNIASSADAFISNIIWSTTVMPNGSWNNDAVNLIILDKIVEKATTPFSSLSAVRKPIRDKLEEALNRTNDSLKEKKLEYFDDKQEIMEEYIDHYVLDDDPALGFFALVH